MRCLAVILLVLFLFMTAYGWLWLWPIVLECFTIRIVPVPVIFDLA